MMLAREWARGPQYAGEAAREAWAPVLRSAWEAWSIIEVASVAAGVRPSARVELTAAELAVASRDASGVGLAIVPLSWDGGRHRCAVTRPELARTWHLAHAAQDDEVIGRLLGFPTCCREKFREVWVERKAADQAPYCDAFAGPWETNVLWRTQGVRLVPHLPCSGDCAESLLMAREMLAVGRENDVDVESLERVLRLPVTYDALNGVALVDAGPFRVMHGTDVTGRFHRPVQAAPGLVAVEGPPSFVDNGFASYSAMRAAHEVILHEAGRSPASWLDLGAGDGALLAQLAGQRVAVEIDPARVERGRRRHPGVEFWTGRAEAYLEGAHGQPFDAVLIMPGRLLELPEDERQAARGALARVADRILVYGYGDWLARYKGLGGLAEAARLRLVSEPAVGAGGAAQAAWAEVIG